MQNEPPRRRPRRRGRGGGARPVRPQAQPLPPPATRSLAKRTTARGPARAPRRRPERSPDELRPGTPCLVLMDCREGEPDRSGAAASFEGVFDFETGEPRRPGFGIPRLRIGPAERVWGFEVWWRPDPTRAGLTDADREALEQSKKLLRTLVRDARRRTPLAVR